MTHFVALVVPKTTDAGEVMDEVRHLLAPYDENADVEAYAEPIYKQPGEARADSAYFMRERGVDVETATDEEIARFWDEDAFLDEDGVWKRVTTYNPRSKWDWWVVGGRWTGFLKLREPGAEDASSGDPGLMTEPNTDPSRADVARLKDVVLEVTDEERARYVALQAFVRAAMETIPPRPGEDADHDAWRAWHEAVKPAYDAYKAFHGDGDMFFLGAEDIEPIYALDAREYAEFRELRSVLAPTVVTPEGGWSESGAYGWFGAHAATWRDNLSMLRRIRAMLRELDPERFIVAVDCHI